MRTNFPTSLDEMTSHKPSDASTMASSSDVRGISVTSGVDTTRSSVSVRPATCALVNQPSRSPV